MSTTMEGVELTETLLTLFDRSPEEFAWRYPICDQVEARRAQMNDQLIFDLLLTMGGIRRPDTLYPPTDVDSLKLLLDAIRDSNYDTLKKDCLIYYLIKWHKDGREEVYRDDKCIPPQFVLLADAYWYLDTGVNVPKAVSILSDVRLNRDNPSKILQAISLSDEATPLILKYVRTAKPLLTEPLDIDTYTVALAESSLLEAWQFQRTFPEVSETRPRLVHKILEWCLSPHPRPTPLAQLLGFPFSNFEQTLIHKYALQPPSTLPPPSVLIIQDLVCVRLIQSGQYASAIKLDRRFAASIIPGTTPKMQKSIQDRRKMMDEILATLPAVERTMVEAELEVEAAGGATPEPSFAKGKARPGQSSTSWQEVKGRSAAVNGSATPARTTPKDLPQFSTTPIVPISARNDMPRFGGSDSRPSDPISGDTFIPISASTPAPSQLHSQAHQSPFTSRPSHLFPLSSSQNSRTPAPLLGSSGIKYSAPLFTQPPASATKPTSSLFTLSGSANQTRNAFYTPPVTSGVKRSDELRPTIEAPQAPNAADEPSAPITNDDVDMEEDDDYAPTRVTNVPGANGTEDAPPVELSYSVFGNSSTKRQPSLKSRRVTRAESEMKMPPGAYVPDEGELAEAATSQNQRHASASPPPLPPVKKARGPSSRAHNVAHEPDLKRSLPGTFISEDDNEEEDYVAPLPVLPQSKRPAKKGRSTRSVEPEEKGPAKPTRRSTRLSTTSSVTSAEPEPPSSRKAAGKARKSTKTSGSTASKTGQRKK